MVAPDQKDKTQSTRGASPFLASSFVVALAVFLLSNAALSFHSPIQFDAQKYVYRGWSWWLLDDLRRNRQVHNVALLGSSLMCSAVAGVDANFLSRSLDLALYHRSAYLDHKLRSKFGGDFSTFNLSAPGQMPSDAYMTLRAMVNCAQRPDVVIYGIAPRDFIDSTLSAPVDTEPFKYLKRLVDIDDVSGWLFRSPFAKLDWWLQKGIYLYGFAMDFRIAFTEEFERFLNVAAPRPNNPPYFTWWDRVRLLPGYMPGEIHDNAVMTSPVDEHTARTTYKDNTCEYLQRYRSPDPLCYKTQVFFLKKLMEFCRRERIELIVVNMPITLYNASMLQPGIYMKYVQAMRQVAFENNVPFYDLCDFVEFGQQDFYDSVHMNAFGGRKFMDRLVDVLAEDHRVASALTLAGKELERHQALAASGHPY